MDQYLESYKIDSPEHVEFVLPLAGLGSRTVAFILDSLIRLAIALILVLILALTGVTATISVSSMSPIALAAIVIVAFLLQWAYFVIFEMRMNGQTPGKRIMKLRVVRDGGYPLTFFASAIRNLLRTIDVLPGLYGVGLLLIFISTKKKRLGDYLAGTIVVHQTETRLAELPEVIRVSAGERRFRLVQLTEEEKKVIRSFLERADTLEFDARKRVGEKLYSVALQKIREVYPDFTPEVDQETLLRQLLEES